MTSSPNVGAVFGELVVVDSVAAEFAERVIEAFLARPSEFFSLFLSGGQTARTCYEALAEAGGAQIDWWRVDVYWGDERCVPLDHEDSNYRLVREALLENVGAVNANYPMRCEDGPDRYHQLVGELGQGALRAARMLGAGPRTILTKVVFRSALPSIFTGLRLGIGVAWTAVIVAEMIAVKSGLGYVLWDAYYVGRMDICVATMFSVGLLGFLSDRVIVLIARLVLHWRSLEAHA